MAQRDTLSSEDMGSRLESEHDFSLTDVFRVLWESRVSIFIGLAVAAVLAILVLVILRVSLYESRMQYIIEFRFDGRAENRYPNGTPFSLGDIIAPAVLTEVYEDLQLADTGMSLRDFQAAVSIFPYSPQRRLIIENYDQFLGRNATSAEIREAQDALSRDLATATSRYAAIDLTLSPFAMTMTRAAEVLSEIARVWEKTAIETRGVVQIDIQRMDPELFDVDNISGMERLTALDYISDNLRALKSFIQRIQAQPGANVVRDTKSGYSAAALLSLLDRSATLLTVLPAGWTEHSAVRQPETLGLPVGLYSDRLFDPDELQNLDYLIAVDLLRERIGLVRDNIRRILDQPFGDVSLDPETQLGTRDVQRLLLELENFTLKQVTAPVLSLGIAKDAAVLNLYYQTRLQELRRERDMLSSKALVLEQAAQTYQGGRTRLSSGDLQDSQGGSTVIPQFGDAFLDRIIGLAQRGGDLEFRQDLLRQTVSLQQQVTEIDEEIRRITEYVNVFSNQPEQRASDGSLERNAAEEIKKQLPLLMNKLKEYAEITQRIAYRLRFAQDIHNVAVAEGSDEIRVDFYLRSADAGEAEAMADLMSRLSAYSVIANRIYEKIGTEALGSYMRLFRPAAEPTEVRGPLVSRFELMVMVLSTLLGLILGAVWGITSQTSGSKRAQHAT